MRIGSGRFRRGMKLKQARTGKALAIYNPILFFAQNRELAEEAYPGDIIGVPNHGPLRVGDTLTEGEDLRFTGIPNLEFGRASCRERVWQYRSNSGVEGALKQQPI